jgi:hypothetical protein
MIWRLELLQRRSHGCEDNLEPIAMEASQVWLVSSRQHDDHGEDAAVFG